MTQRTLCTPPTKWQQVAGVTFTGTLAIAAGAVLTTYVPALQRPTDWMAEQMGLLTEKSRGIPLVEKALAENTLLQSPHVRRFLATSTMETLLSGILVLTLGAVLGLMHGSARKEPGIER